MIRRLPRTYTHEVFVNELSAGEFRNQFDFVHLPWDQKHRRGRGFAFINFKTEAAALSFYQRYHNRHFSIFGQLPVQLALADVQGDAALQAQLQRSS